MFSYLPRLREPLVNKSMLITGFCYRLDIIGVRNTQHSMHNSTDPVLQFNYNATSMVYRYWDFHYP